LIYLFDLLGGPLDGQEVVAPHPYEGVEFGGSVYVAEDHTMEWAGDGQLRNTLAYRGEGKLEDYLAGAAPGKGEVLT
jgi:hypothetical protein